MRPIIFVLRIYFPQGPGGVGQAGAGANLLGGKGMEIWPTRGNEQTETMDQIVPSTSFFEAKMAGKV